MIFFAIRGERVDGNEFAREALQRGASYAVIDKPGIKQGKYADRMIVVKNTVKTLQDLAIFHRKKCSIPVLAITGSNGKTTTKNLVASVLKHEYKLFATPGNLNSYIGLPLSILKIEQAHQMAVLELGANYRGELELLSKIAAPTHGLITNIGKDHLEGYGGWEGVVASHQEFTGYLEQTGGFYFLNRDDPELVKMAVHLEKETYGQDQLDPVPDCAGRTVKSFPSLEVRITSGPVKARGESFVIHSRLPGKFHFSNVMAAVCVGQYFGVSNRSIKKAIESYEPRDNRTQLIHQGSNTILLDAYNANPTSMSLVIKEFASVRAPKKVAILGDMFELGKYSNEEHRQIIEELKQQDMQVVLVGKAFGKFKDELECLHFNDLQETREWLQNTRFEDTWILIKGSRGMELEKLLRENGVGSS